MDKLTTFVFSIFAIGVVLSSVTESEDRFADVSSDEQEIRVSIQPSEVNGLVGETVRLDCTSPPPNNYELRWARADNAPLPQTAEDLDGALIIRDADSDASGVYICNAVSELTNNTVSNASVTVNIVESNHTSYVPTLNIEPERQTVLAGSLAVIRCTSPTHPNATITWRKGHSRFTSHVQILNNEIRIPSATVEDRGVYICECANAAGAARVPSKLEIDGRRAPVVEIYPEARQRIEINGNASIECRVRKGIPRPKIRWLRRGQQVSSSHVVEAEGVLRFTGVTEEDDGEYACSAENAVGSMDAIAVLEIISRPVVTASPACPSPTVARKENNVFPLHRPTADVTIETTIEIESSLNETTVGNTLHLTCKVKGDASASTVWMKADGDFEKNVQTRGNVLNITDMQMANDGAYRCVTFTKGRFKFMDYHLNISKVITLSDDIIRELVYVTQKSVKYGHDVDLFCETAQDPPPLNYSWTVYTREKSVSKIFPNTRTLTVTNASADNNGYYLCAAASSRVTPRTATILTVENVIPAFAGNSYLTLPLNIGNWSARTDIEIDFKPESPNGLILFDGHCADAKCEFISFGLNGGIPEFRYDLGGGAAIIRGDEPLSMKRWHRVLVHRETKDGFMLVNGMSNFTGQSPNVDRWLQVPPPVFVGGHSNYTFVSALTGLNTGFKGCIRRLRSDSNEMIYLKETAVSLKNVKSCDKCDVERCPDYYLREEMNSSTGYDCIIGCDLFYKGCPLRGNTRSTCNADSCEAGECLENENGIECLCPLGTTDQQCSTEINITEPAFAKNSYVAYPLPNLKNEFKLLLKLKPVRQANVDNGIISYVAESDNGNGDFIALSIVNSFVELRSKVMGRSISITSKRYLVPDEYVTVNLTMDSSQVVLSVGDATTFMSYSEVLNEDLRLNTLLYVGGYDNNSISLPQQMSERNGFHGCISTMELLGKDLDIRQSNVKAINVNDCSGLLSETYIPTHQMMGIGPVFETCVARVELYPMDKR